MSLAEIERFAEDLKANAGLKEELTKAGADEASIVAFANGKGYDFTADELKDAVEKKKGNLSEEDLEKVAGGAIIIITIIM